MSEEIINYLWKAAKNMNDESIKWEKTLLNGYPYLHTEKEKIKITIPIKNGKRLQPFFIINKNYYSYKDALKYIRNF